MLAKFYRFHIVNNTGQTATFDDGASLSLRIQAWKLVSGVLTYNTVVIDDMGFGAGESIVDGAFVTSSQFDNSSDLFWELNGVLIAVHDLDAAVGHWALYIEGTDNAAFFPSDEDDFLIEQDAHLVRTLRVDNDGVDASNGMDFSWD